MGNIATYVLRKRRFTIMILVALVVNGFLGLNFMPRSEDPTIEMKECSIIVTYPGASPEDIEDLILDPLENLLMGLEEVEHINSWAMDGALYMVPEFRDEFNIDDAIEAANGALVEAKNEFPPGVLRTEIIRHRTDRVLTLLLAITGDGYSYKQLEDYAETIKDELRLIQEVRLVEIEGAQRQEVRISVDIDKLAGYGISILDVADRIKAANLAIPAGKIEMPGRKFNVSMSGDFESILDVRETIIHNKNGMPVKLKDIADVKLAMADSIYWVRDNGKKAIFVTVSQKEGTNLLDLGRKAKEVLADVEAKFPSDVNVDIIFDQSDNVQRRLSEFSNNLLYGGALVAFVVLVLVGGRLALVICTAIPLSIIIGIGGMYLYGLHFEQISIAGLILALGMLVDNAIVISENIQRHLNLGYSRWEAAEKGVKEVASAVFSATLTTIAAFIPMVAISGASGMFIRSMPITVAFALTASLIVAFTATPLISAAVLRPSKGGEHGFARALHRFGNKYYPSILSAALKRPKWTITATIAALIISIGLFNKLGKEFFPKANKPVFIIEINRPEGANLASVDSVIRLVEEDVLGYPGVLHAASNIGKGSPVIYYNMGRTREKDDYGQVLVSMDPDLPYEKVYDLIVKLRNKWSDYPGAKIDVKEFTQGPPIGAPIAIRVSGDDLNVLRNLTAQFEEVLLQTEGTLNIDNELSGGGGEIRIEIDNDRAGMLGIPQFEIARTIRLALAGESLTKFRMEGEDRDVVIRLPFDSPPTWDALSRIYFRTALGKMVPLYEIATPEITGGASTIAHRDGERNFAVRSDVQEGYFAADISKIVSEKLKSINFPEGYKYTIEGETQERDESFESLFSAAIIAMLVIYAILVFQFNSFRQPLVIFTALPMAFIGAILGLYLTRSNFGFMAFIGLESLIGIVINDAIVLLEFVNQRLKEGASRAEALLEAGKIRFVPILLTSITTIGGLMPLTLFSGKLYSPMGWTMVGGLTFSTVLTLVIIPVLFMLMVRKERVDNHE